MLTTSPSCRLQATSLVLNGGEDCTTSDSKPRLQIVDGGDPPPTSTNLDGIDLNTSILVEIDGYPVTLDRSSMKTKFEEPTDSYLARLPTVEAILRMKCGITNN